MALTLIATAGATDANSYCTVAEAATYFESRLHASSWTSVSDKPAALVWATRLLDQQMVWNGTIGDTDQALRWPRRFVYSPDNVLMDETVIPTFLKNATAEYARLLAASDRTADPDTAGFSEMKLGSMGLKVKSSDRAPVMPPSVWEIVRWYGSRKKGAGQYRRLIRG